MANVTVVVGGQFGSEGKGRISAYLSMRQNIDICVRCGGPNSGHSFVDEFGNNKILRQLPTGLTNSSTRLLIPAGALVNPSLLLDEMELFGVDSSRIGVDKRSLIIEQSDIEIEKTLQLDRRISSTLSGVGSAVSRRVLRGPNVRLARDVLEDFPWLAPLLTDVGRELNLAVNEGKRILIEGTQGFGLSLYHSQFYPHVTSRDTTAASFISEVGLSPLVVTEIVLVLRTFPIRVAGSQAGPLKDEINWDILQQESQYPHKIVEFTSVTNKVRRIARFDWGLAEAAILYNRPTTIALTGLDYINYANKGVTNWGNLTKEAKTFVQRLENMLAVPVRYLGTGPGMNELFDRQKSLTNESTNFGKFRNKLVGNENH